MKRFLIVLSLCLAFCGTSFGQTAADAPASKEDVERYMQAIHSHEMMKQMVEAMTKPMHQMVHDQFMKNKEKLPADFEAQMNKSMDDMLQGMPWDEMLDAMAPVYQKHLTKGDIDVMVAFYSAPTGQKMLREMPAMMGEAMQSMVPIMQKSVEKMKEHLQEQVAQMLKDPSRTGQDAPPAQN